jgi:hypothetical protein
MFDGLLRKNVGLPDRYRTGMMTNNNAEISAVDPSYVDMDQHHTFLLCNKFMIRIPIQIRLCKICMKQVPY